MEVSLCMVLPVCASCRHQACSPEMSVLVYRLYFLYMMQTGYTFYT